MAMLHGEALEVSEKKTTLEEKAKMKASLHHSQQGQPSRFLSQRPIPLFYSADFDK